MSTLRSLLLTLVLLVIGAWLAAGAALALFLPQGWGVTNWPLSVPGFAVKSPEGARLSWTPWAWRDLRITGQNITPRGGGLGRITTFDAELTLHGPPTLPVQAWGDAGGFVEIRGVTVLWGPLRFSGAGALRPAPEGGLRGPLRGRLDGFSEAAGALARAGIITQAEARGAGNPLGREVEMPLAIQDGRLMLGPLPLAVWR